MFSQVFSYIQMPSFTAFSIDIIIMNSSAMHRDYNFCQGWSYQVDVMTCANITVILLYAYLSKCQYLLRPIREEINQKANMIIQKLVFSGSLLVFEDYFSGFESFHGLLIHLSFTNPRYFCLVTNTFHHDIERLLLGPNLLSDSVHYI